MKNLESDKAFQRDALLDLNRMLDEELAKPAKKRDYQKIEEISRSCAAIMGDEEQEEQLIGQGYKKLIASVQKSPIRVTRRFKLLMSVGVAAVVLLAANAISVAAFHQDVFSVIIHYAEHSFSVEYPNDKKLELPTTPNDPYGIKTECAKYGLYVLAPTYLPEGFELCDCVTNVADGFCTSVDFRFYRNKREVIAITYNYFIDATLSSSIPSDDMNLREVKIQGTPAIISEEDGQYTMIVKIGNLETIISSDCGYNECDKIIASLE